MGIGDWGLGVWGCGFGGGAPTPNPQSPIPNPQSPMNTNYLIFNIIINKKLQN